MTTDSPLYIAFLWHMHQPYYKDPVTGLYRLPWVRLHGTKDYLDMVEILSEFPHIKQTFNFAPSLLKQILEYTENNVKDKHLEITIKQASELNEEEKIFILNNFFLANWDTMIKQFPRYYELLTKRGLHVAKSDLVQTVNCFNTSDLLDLQVLFNLCWIDPLLRKQDPFFTTLAEKGRDYKEEEKHMLISKQFALLEKIIPTYREKAQTGQIELSVSPFYHPILPLLCDTNSAKIAEPDVKLPQTRFTHPEDAEKQIRMAIEFFGNLFGSRPAGMWPSEGSVSEEVLRLVSKEGIQWIGTDEAILSHSIGKRIRDSSGNVIEPQTLYNPYTLENVSIIFRDQTISDLIGFVYSQWDSKKAAGDLISRLIHVHTSLPNDKPRLLSIILDGENAWEYYTNDGHDFLRYLYEGLSKEKRLQTVTVSEYLKEYDKGKALKRLHAGSWIYGNFSIWIGHEEDNIAWDYLSEARKELELFQNMNPGEDLSRAWDAIYIAEGSDWTWWYGDEHTSETQKDFDELFRLNLAKVYQEMGKDIPQHLFIPVHVEDRGVSPAITIRGFIEPKIDGVVTSYFEWYQSARMDIEKTGGSMHKSGSIFANLYYGFNKAFLFLRVDPVSPLSELHEASKLSITFIKPSLMKIIVSIRPSITAELFKKSDGEWEKVKDIPDVAIKDIFEIGIPFHDLCAREKDEIHLSVSLMKNEEEIERCPWRGHITLTVPSPDFEALMWY